MALSPELRTIKTVQKELLVVHRIVRGDEIPEWKLE